MVRTVARKLSSANVQVMAQTHAMTPALATGAGDMPPPALS